MLNATTARFDEKYDHEKGFARHFRKRIAPVLDEIERSRKRTLFLLYACIGVETFSLASLLLFLPFYEQGLNDTEQKVRFFLYFAAVALVVLSVGFCISRYKSKTKAVMTPLVLEFFGEGDYTPDGMIPQSETKPFGILPSCDRYKGEDFFHFRDVGGARELSFCELRLTEERGSGKNRHTVTTFNGVALLITLPRAVKSPITLKPERFLALEFSWGSPTGVPMEKVTLEDPVFERLFDVRSGDQIEARRVLQPALMVRLVQFGMLMEHWGKSPDKLPAGIRPDELPSPAQVETARFKFSAAFRENKLLLLVPCKRDMFETGSVFRSAYDTNEIRCFLYQMHLTRLIVDELGKFPQL